MHANTKYDTYKNRSMVSTNADLVFLSFTGITGMPSNCLLLALELVMLYAFIYDCRDFYTDTHTYTYKQMRWETRLYKQSHILLDIRNIKFI